MAEDSGQERNFEATPQKLEEARRKGDVLQSRDLTSFGLYLGLVLGVAIFGGAAVRGVGEALLPFLARVDQLAGLDRPDALADALGGLGLALAWHLAPLALAPAVGVALALAAQGCVTFAGTRLAPKVERVSPFANAKQKFGPAGLVEFLKGFAKTAATGVVIGLVLWPVFEDASVLTRLDVRLFGDELSRRSLALLTPIVVLAGVIGLADLLWQRHSRLKRLRMTLEEMRAEHKNSEGDPHVKHARRERAMAIAANRMLLDVPEADVVVTNPTHYAVALKWDRGRRGSAPRCVAKGADALAQTIKRVARENGVALVEDRKLARSLHALVEVGEEIRVEHYRAVAAALHFAAQRGGRRGRR